MRRSPGPGGSMASTRPHCRILTNGAVRCQAGQTWIFHGFLPSLFDVAVAGHRDGILNGVEQAQFIRSAFACLVRNPFRGPPRYV